MDSQTPQLNLFNVLIVEIMNDEQGMIPWQGRVPQTARLSSSTSKTSAENPVVNT